MTTPSTYLLSRHTVAVALAAVAAVAVAASAFTRSFSALSDLAVMHQWPATEAWILPIALDGMIVVPTVAAVVRRSARWYAWFLLVAGTILSCAGNGVHAWLTTTSHIAVALAVIPPLVTLAAVHLTILLARQASDTATAPASDTAPEPIRATVPANTDRDDRTDTTPARPVTRLRVAPETAPRPAATPRQDHSPATPKANATDDELKTVAIRRVVEEGKTVRATGAELGVSKDKVQRWVTAHRATLERATVAV